MSADDQHSSFIKTPQQLITVVVLAFAVPIFGIVLLVQLVTSGRGADPGALTPQAVAARIQPIGQWKAGDTGSVGGAAQATAAAGGKSGEEVFKSTCSACHQTGVAGAPKFGDRAAWAPRIKEGLKELLHSALNGKKAMPAKGGNASLSDDEVARAVVYMANHGGAKFKEPAPAQAPAQQKSGAKPAAGQGKQVFDGTCTACHSTGVAGAPKLGDKAAWAPRIQQGVDTLVQHALHGKNAMPPKGGNASLSDAQVRAAVEFMVSQAK